MFARLPERYFQLCPFTLGLYFSAADPRLQLQQFQLVVGRFFATGAVLPCFWTNGQTSAAGEHPQHIPVPVLVAVYLVVPVKDRSRSPVEKGFALSWVPTRLLPDGTLQSDSDRLPFVPRVLLDSAHRRAHRTPTQADCIVI